MKIKSNSKLDYCLHKLYFLKISQCNKANKVESHITGLDKQKKKLS